MPHLENAGLEKREKRQRDGNGDTLWWSFGREMLIATADNSQRFFKMMRE